MRYHTLQLYGGGASSKALANGGKVSGRICGILSDSGWKSRRVENRPREKRRRTKQEARGIFSAICHARSQRLSQRKSPIAVRLKTHTLKELLLRPVDKVSRARRTTNSAKPSGYLAQRRGLRNNGQGSSFKTTLCRSRGED